MKRKILSLALILILIFIILTPLVNAENIYYVRGTFFNNDVKTSNNPNSLSSYGYLFGKIINLNPNQFTFEVYFIPKNCSNQNSFIYIWSYNTTKLDASKSYSIAGITTINCKITFIWYQPISGAGLSYTSLTSTITLNAKYHVVVTFDKPTLYFYVNGSFITQQNVGANTLYNSTITINLGGWYGCFNVIGCQSRYGSNSTVYLFRVYNTTLNQMQINYNFNNVQNFNFTNYYSNNLILYYAPFSIINNRWINVAQNNYLTDIILVNTQLENLPFYYSITTTTSTIYNQVSFNFGSIGYILAILFIGIGALALIYMSRRI